MSNTSRGEAREPEPDLMRTAARLLAAGLVVGVAVVLCASPPAAHAQDSLGVRGESDYMRYCSACHGERADGNGPVANVIHPRPPALTQLYARYGRPLGTKLVAYVMGETMPRAHGTSDMPVWGRNLEEPDGTDAKAVRIIWRIIDYLDRIQVETSEPPVDRSP